MDKYPEALVVKIARALAHANDDYADHGDGLVELIWHPYLGDAVAALDALGYDIYGGPKYWRSAIHVEDE